MKRLKTLLLLLAASATTTWAGVMKSTQPTVKDGYYVVTSQTHLQWLAEYVNSKAYMDSPKYLRVRLEGDLSLNNMGASDYIDPIGGQTVTLTSGKSTTSYFYGEFDGKDHYLGYRLRPYSECVDNGNPNNTNYRGLFGKVQGSKICNLLITAPATEGKGNVGGVAGMASSTTFENITVYYPRITCYGNFAGGVAGSAEYSTFKYCITTNGNKDASNNSTSLGYVRNDGVYTGQGNVGGIVGSLQSGSASYCVNMVDVYIKNNGEVAGGIAGLHYASSASHTISHCGNIGAISSSSYESTMGSTGDASGYYAGGIVGQTMSQSGLDYTIDACFSNAPVNALKRCGYLVGWSGSKTGGSCGRLMVKDCYYVQRECKAGYGSVEPIMLPIYQTIADLTERTNTQRIVETDLKYGRVAFGLNSLGEEWSQTLCRAGQSYYDATPTPSACTSLKALTKVVSGLVPRKGLVAHLDANGDHECDLCLLTAGETAEPDRDANGVLQISSYKNLFWLRDMHNSLALHNGENRNGSNLVIPSFNATLTADITMPTGAKWTGIGTLDAPYTGIFDGQGHTISAINAACGNKPDYIGLFGYADGAVIQNVKIAKSTFTGRYYTGAIVADARNETYMAACYTASDVTVTGSEHVGGIAGNFRGGITRCTNCANVVAVSNADIKVAHYIGGIAGDVRGIVSECLNFGPVGIQDKKNLAAFVGGIAGSAVGAFRYNGNAGNVNEKYSSENVSSLGECQRIGGLVGSIEGLNGNKFVWEENFSCAAKVCGPAAEVGLVAGWAKNGNMSKTLVRKGAVCDPATKLITNNYLARVEGEVGANITPLEERSFYDGSLIDLLTSSDWGQILCTDIVPHRANVYNQQGVFVKTLLKAEHGDADSDNRCQYCHDPFGIKPALDAEGYYLVSLPQHLVWFREQAAAWTGSGNYTFKARLQNDIDLSTCRIWTSIGDVSADARLIQVTFDGQGHTIFGLGHKPANAASLSSRCAGLFGNLISSSISNLTLDTAWPGSNLLESYYATTAPSAGILCATLSGEVSHVTTKGAIVGSNVQAMGGMVGHAMLAGFEDCTNEAMVLNGRTLEDMTTDTPTGGIVGSTYLFCTLNRCVNNGSVSTSGHQNFTGGLIGRAYEAIQITNSANTASVTNTPECTDRNCAHGKVGGIIGGVMGGDLAGYVGMQVENTWNYGAVSNGYDVGSFIGYVETNCKEGVDVFSHCVTINDGHNALGSVPAGFPTDIDRVDRAAFADGTVAAKLLAPWGHNIVRDADGRLMIASTDRYPQLDGVTLFANGGLSFSFQGDYNADGRWNAADAKIMGDILASGIVDPDNTELLPYYDLNHDGVFSIADVTLLIERMKQLGE